MVVIFILLWLCLRRDSPFFIGINNQNRRGQRGLGIRRGNYMGWIHPSLMI
jgi:hypothetical protein